MVGGGNNLTNYYLLSSAGKEQQDGTETCQSVAPEGFLRGKYFSLERWHCLQYRHLCLSVQAEETLTDFKLVNINHKR